MPLEVRLKIGRLMTSWNWNITQRFNRRHEGDVRIRNVDVTLSDSPNFFTTNGFLLAHKPALPASSFNHDGPAKGKNDIDCGGTMIVRVPWRLVLVREAYIKSNGVSHGTASVFVVAKY